MAVIQPILDALKDQNLRFQSIAIVHTPRDDSLEYPHIMIEAKKGDDLHLMRSKLSSYSFRFIHYVQGWREDKMLQRKPKGNADGYNKKTN